MHRGCGIHVWTDNTPKSAQLNNVPTNFKDSIGEHYTDPGMTHEELTWGAVLEVHLVRSGTSRYMESTYMAAMSAGRGGNAVMLAILARKARS